MSTVPNRYLPAGNGNGLKNIHQQNRHVYGRGLNGTPFYSKQAWLASKAHAIEQRLGGLNESGAPGVGHPLAGGGAGGPAQASPFHGLAGVISALSGGPITAQQLANMNAGYTGGNGHAVGGMHGALSGLSDYAVNWLANSGLLQANTPQAVPTTDANGQPLTGTALLLANIQNQLNQSAPKTYSLAQGVTADQLGGLLGQAMHNIGQNVYAKGYGATGPK